MAWTDESVRHLVAYRVEDFCIRVMQDEKFAYVDSFTRVDTFANNRATVRPLEAPTGQAVLRHEVTGKGFSLGKIHTSSVLHVSAGVNTVSGESLGRDT